MPQIEWTVQERIPAPAAVGLCVLGVQHWHYHAGGNTMRNIRDGTIVSLQPTVLSRPRPIRGRTRRNSYRAIDTTVSSLI